MIWFTRMARVSDTTDAVLFPYLPLGLQDDGISTWAVDMGEIDLEERSSFESRRVDHLPENILQNVSPFRPVRIVRAAGGIVLNANSDEVNVLAIKRRGVWDLPKGKQDAGERIQTAALREVREETGVKQLQRMRRLGTTTHGYERDGYYMVKHTHWYLMTSAGRNLIPQQSEDIEEVRWMPYSLAIEQMGYPSLQEALRRWGDKVHQGFAERLSLTEYQ